jgi:rhodanese-related sulfurtransferase
LKRSFSCFIGVLLTSVALLGASGCGEAGATITPDQLLARMESGSPPLLLDVRSAGEYGSGHVPGAINIPHAQLPARLPELAGAKGREVVVYCERGGRASTAEQTLRDAGFTQVIHLEGDMSGWRRNDLPTQRP